MEGGEGREREKEGEKEREGERKQDFETEARQGLKALSVSQLISYTGSGDVATNRREITKHFAGNREQHLIRMVKQVVSEEAESLDFPCLDVGCRNSSRTATARPALPGRSGEGDPTAAAGGQHGAPGAASGARGAARRLTHSPVTAAGVDLGERGGAAGLQRGRSALRSQQSQQSQQRQRAGPPGAAAAHRAGAASLPAPPSSRTPLRAGPSPASCSGSGCGWAESAADTPPLTTPIYTKPGPELQRLTPPHGAGAAAAPGPPCLHPASGGGG